MSTGWSNMEACTSSDAGQRLQNFSIPLWSTGGLEVVPGRLPLTLHFFAPLKRCQQLRMSTGWSGIEACTWGGGSSIFMHHDYLILL